jgi:hypothetical protein
MRPVNQVPAHWSKDFVEHLRTVHFALLAVSAGLILLVLSAREYNPNTALAQVEEILNLKQVWSINWVEQYGKESKAVYPWSIGRDISGDYVVGYLLATDDEGRDHNYVVDCTFPQENWYQISGTHEVSPARFPETLEDFHKWWDGLREPYKIYVPEQIALVNEGSGSDKFDVYIRPDDRTKDHIKARFSIDQSPRLDDERLYYYFEAETPEVGRDAIVGIPIARVRQYEVTQQAIGNRYSKFRAGPFNESFADLRSATNNYTDLPLIDIKEFLHDEASKGQEVFEAFGMKFPAGRVALWGTILLTSVQLYFVVYLRQLSGKLRADDPGWDVPWVGMDTSGLGQIILFVSLIALPVAAMALLGGRAFLVWRNAALPDDWWHRLLHRSEPFALATALIASICLGILSWRYRPKVEAEEPPYSSPLFY